MSTDTQQIVNKAWNFAHVLRDDGLSYMAYTEQITFLLFLKMADELTKPPYNRKPIVPAGYDWPSLLKQDGDELEAHYRHILEELGKKPGMLGEIFKKARPEIQNPATLRRLIVDLIDPEKWSSMEADVKGDIYEGLLAKSAAESPKGAGQYFTPRELIKAIVDCVQPTAADTRLRPGLRHGRLPAGRSRIRRPTPRQGPRPGPEEAPEARLREGLGTRAEHGPAVHHEPVPPRHRRRPLPDRLGRGQPGQRSWRRFSLVLTNPPFGKKSHHRHRQRGRRPGEGRRSLRTAGLLDDRRRTSS